MTLSLLENCQGECTHSCQECLRHYANQYWHERMDRHLAAHLLRYTIYGTVPDTSDLVSQGQKLYSLQRMLELEGYTCSSGSQINSFYVPLLVKNHSLKLAIGTYNGLLDKYSEYFVHPLYDTLNHIYDEIKVEIINEYFLDQNLPGAYQTIRNILES